MWHADNGLQFFLVCVTAILYCCWHANASCRHCVCTQLITFRPTFLRVYTMPRKKRSIAVKITLKDATEYVVTAKLPNSSRLLTDVSEFFCAAAFAVLPHDANSKKYSDAYCGSLAIDISSTGVCKSSFSFMFALVGWFCVFLEQFVLVVF